MKTVGSCDKNLLAVTAYGYYKKPVSCYPREQG